MYFSNVLSPKEVLALFDAVQNFKHKTMLFMGYAAGLRASEVVNLRIIDFGHKVNKKTSYDAILRLS